MLHKKILLLTLCLGIILLGLFGSGSLTKKPSADLNFISTAIASSGISSFEIIRAAASTWLITAEQISASAPELYKNFNDNKPANNPFIIDVRQVNPESPNIYVKGHIPGAINIPWREVFKKDNLSKLPKDRKIVVYSYNGHIGGQVNALLNILGYNAGNLMWGMTAWTLDEQVAPGRYDESKHCKAYRIEKTINEPCNRYPLPVSKIISSEDKLEIIRRAAQGLVRSDRLTNISAQELFGRLSDARPGNDPFILSVRKAQSYAKGHIPGAINIPWREVFKKDNLTKLPKGRRILVYGYNGQISSQVTALLNALGYNASNLLWGMSSWTFKKDVAPGRYDKSKDCMDYYFVTGTLPVPEEPRY